MTMDATPMDDDVQVGDVVGFHDSWWYAKMIRFWEWLDDRFGRLNHVAIVTAASGSTGGPVLLEALRRVRTTFLAEYGKRKIVVYRYRHLPTSAATRLHFCAQEALGDVYGCGKLILNALDCFFRTYWFTRHFGLKHWKQCANLVGWCYRHILDADGKAFGVPWRCLRPDTIDKWCREHPEDWECVRDDIGHKGTSQNRV